MLEVGGSRVSGHIVLDDTSLDGVRMVQGGGDELVSKVLVPAVADGEFLDVEHTTVFLSVGTEGVFVECRWRVGLGVDVGG